MGRKKIDTWLTEKGLAKVEELASQDISMNEISEKMGIHISTFCDWKDRFPTFDEAYKKGRAKAIEKITADVEDVMYKNARGLAKVEETTYERQFNRKTGEYEMVEVKRTVKSVPPSTTAQIFILKNKLPNDYKDKVEAEITGELPVVISGGDELAD